MLQRTPVPLKGTIAMRTRCTLRAKVVKGRKSTIAFSLCSSCQATGDDVNAGNLVNIEISDRHFSVRLISQVLFFLIYMWGSMGPFH